MLQVIVADGGDRITFKLEVKLNGPWVGEVEQCWLTMIGADPTQTMQIDLTDIAFVAPEGRALLARMTDAGVELIGSDPVIRALVEGILVRAQGDQESSGGGDTAA